MKICPEPGTVKLVNRRESEHQLAVLKALGDETRYAMYEELARSTAAAVGLGPRRAARAPPEHRAPPPRPPARGGPGRRRAVHRGTVGRPQHLYFLPPAHPGSGSTRPRTRCSPGCSPPWPSASAPTPTTPPRRHGSGAPTPGKRTRAGSCLGALEAELDQLGFEPGADEADGADGRAPGSNSCTARSGSWPRPTPSWCATSTVGLCEGVVDAVGGGRVEEFATLYDPEPCHVTVARIGTLDKLISAPEHRRRFDVLRPGRQHRLHPHRRRRRQGEEPHRGRRQPRAWPCASRCAPVAAPASATRCSSTPTSRATTSRPSTAASPSSSTPPARAPRWRRARLQGRPAGRRVRHQQPQRPAQLRLRPVLQLTRPKSAFGAATP